MIIFTMSLKLALTTIKEQNTAKNEEKSAICKL